MESFFLTVARSTRDTLNHMILPRLESVIVDIYPVIIASKLQSTKFILNTFAYIFLFYFGCKK